MLRSLCGWSSCNTRQFSPLPPQLWNIKSRNHLILFESESPGPALFPGASDHRGPDSRCFWFWQEAKSSAGSGLSWGPAPCRQGSGPQGHDLCPASGCPRWEEGCVQAQSPNKGRPWQAPGLQPGSASWLGGVTRGRKLTSLSLGGMRRVLAIPAATPHGVLTVKS